MADKTLNQTTGAKGSILVFLLLFLFLLTGAGPSKSYSLPEVSVPVIDSILRLSPTSEMTLAENMIFRVYFSDSVQNVDFTDFEIVAGGARGIIQSVDMQSPDIYDVNITGINGSGLVEIGLSNAVDVTDNTGNPLQDTEPVVKQTFTILHGLEAPVMDISTTASRPSSTSPIPVKIIFNEPVNGFELSDIITENTAIQNFKINDTIIFKSRFEGAGAGHFSNPQGLAIDGLRNIYVADYANSRVQKFDKNGNFIFEIGGYTWPGAPEDGKFNLCYDVDIDASGNFYVTDRTGRVQKFDKDGSFLSKFMGADTNPDGYPIARGIAIDHSGNIYVSDLINKKVRKFDKDGNFLLEFGSGGSGPGQFYEIGGVAVDNNNNIYVTDIDTRSVSDPSGDHNRIHKFDASGNFIETLGGSGDGLSEFNYPKYIELDEQNNIYVTEPYNSRVQKIDGNGNFLEYFGRRYGISGDDKINGPSGIALDRSGNIYVVDEYSNAGLEEYPNIRILKESTIISFEIVPDAYGEVSFHIPANSATDRDNNGNDSTHFSISYFDDNGPVVNSIRRLSPSDALTNDSAVSFQVDFSEEVQNVDASDFVIATGGVTGTISVSKTDTTSYIIEINGISGEGILNIDFVPGQDIEDLSSLAFSGNIKSEQYFLIDQQSPSAKFSTNASNPTNQIPVPVRLDFDERIFDFEAENDLLFTNASLDTAFKRDTIFDLDNFGNEGIGNGQFSFPEGVEYDSYGNIYVADYSNHRVQKLDSVGNFIMKFGTNGTGEGEFDNPCAIKVDNAGYIYVVDYRNHRVQKFDPSGNFILQFGSYGSNDGEMIFPSDIAFGKDGNIYVLERGNERVQKFDPSGNFISKFGAAGTGNSQFDRPEGICVDDNGNIYVLDTYNNRIQKFNSSGTYITQFGSEGEGPVQFIRPKGIEADGGKLYIAGFNSQRIQVLDSIGNFLTEYSPEKGSGPDQINYPAKLSMNHEGELIVSDHYNHRLKKLRHNIFYNIELIPDSSDTVKVELPANSAYDAAGNGNSYAVFSILFDNTAPAIDSIKRLAPLSIKTNKDSVIFNIYFSKIVENVDTSDFTIAVGEISGDISEVNRVNDKVFTLKIVNVSGNDTLQIELSDDQDITDSIGNSLDSTIPYNEYYLVDDIAPGISITSTAISPTDINPVPISITFSEAVTELEESDLNIVNATVSEFIKVDSLHYSMNLVPISSDSISLEIAGNSVYDLFGNGNEASRFSIYYDTVPSVANISRYVPAQSYTSTATAVFMVSFDEDVLNIDASDFKLANSPVNGEIDTVLSMSDSQYFVFIINISGNGVLDLDFEEDNNITDILGRPYKGAINTEQRYTIDHKHPETTISSIASPRTNLSPIPVEITFDEPVTELYEDSLQVTNASVSNYIRVDSSHYTLDLIPGSSGEINLELPYNAVRDRALNESYAEGFEIIYDTLPSQVSISRHTPIQAHTNATEVTFTVSFDEAVTNVDASDFEIKNGGSSGIISNITVIDNKRYSLQVSNISGNGILNLDFAGSQDIRDSLGYNFEGEIALEHQYYIDQSAPEISITTTATDPTNISPVPVHISWNEKISSFRKEDLVPGNAVIDTFHLQDTMYYHSQFGSMGFGDGQFMFPGAAEIDAAGNIYVTDMIGNKVQKFDSAGNFLSAIGSMGSDEGQFMQPYDIAVDDIGNVFVLDQGNNRVQKFDPSGNFLMEFGSEGSGDGQLQGASGIALDGSGHLYIADAGNNRIQKFDAAGNFVWKFGSGGTGDGQFSTMNFITADNKGNVLVVDQGNARIQKFDTYGNYILQFGSMGSGEGQFSMPGGIDVDPLGNIYVSDFGNNSIQKFDASGNFISAMVSEMGSDDGQFNGIWDVEVGAKVYAVDFSNARVQVLENPVNVLLELSPQSSDTVKLTFPEGTITDASGNENLASTLSLVFDTITETPQLQMPVSNSFTQSPVHIQATLPETPLANSVKMEFYGESDTIEFTLADDTSFDFDLDITDPMISMEISAATGHLSEGVYDIALQYNDALGNPVAKVINTHVTIDNTLPAAPSVNYISEDSGADTTDGLTSDNTVVFYGTAEAHSRVEFFIDGTLIGDTLTDGTGKWIFDHSLVSLENGTYEITVKVTDRAGNESNLSDIFDLKIDTVTPVFTLVVPDQQMCYGTVLENLSFTVNDSGPGILELNIASSDTSIIPLEDIILSGTYPDYQLEVQRQEPSTGGTIIIKVTATDGAGTSEMNFEVSTFSALKGGSVGFHND